MERRQAMIFSYITMDRHHCQDTQFGLLVMSHATMEKSKDVNIINACQWHRVSESISTQTLVRVQHSERGIFF
ncbi:hypothetical protein BLOT_008051 [Blomia tropicalis]|nr:hypothetical protein BLOT_008051 [Blomia tropicalis]